MSLKQIAQMVGVSPSTVSRVLNKGYTSCASKELKDKIWAAARQIQYVPNTNAQNLKKGEQKSTSPYHFSVLFTRIDVNTPDPFFLELCRYIETELFARHCYIDQMTKADVKTLSKASTSDGILLLGRCSEELLRKLKQANKNIVGIWRNPTNFDIDEVVCDGKKAAAMAVEHLISLGHTQIGYIGDCSYESRYIGYCETLIQHKLPINYPHIISTHQTYIEGMQAAISFVSNNCPTAILCANDATALGVLKGLEQYPKYKISVISIDNIEEAQQTKPLLTSINIPRSDMAHMAIQMLIDRIQKKHSEYIRMEFPCRIVERESCFPYKN